MQEIKGKRSIGGTKLVSQSVRDINTNVGKEDSLVVMSEVE